MKHTKQTTWELYAKTIRMRAAEKRALRERVVAYMEYHPMRVPLTDATAVPTGSPVALTSEPFVTMRFGSWQFRAFASVFALVCMVGVPAFAERSVPGDVLYLMKVNVNEEVLGSLAWDGAGKVAWEAERVERRIAEARLLAQEGKLTAEAEAQLALTVREHTENASRELEVLRATDAEGAEVAQAALESTLDVQTVMLASDAASTTAPTSSLAIAIAEVKQGVGAHDPSLDDALSPEKLTALLESETTRARELLAAISDSVPENERSDIERRLVDIERAVTDARILHETARREQAFALQRAIMADIQKLVEYMTNIDVRSSVSLESLVPLKLTEEEKFAAVSTDLEDVKNREVDLRALRTALTDRDISAKFDAGHNELEALILLAEDARAANNVDAAAAHILTARALIDDLSMLARTLTPVTLPTEEVPETQPAPEATTTPEVATTTPTT